MDPQTHPIDLAARQDLARVLRRILRDEITGWEIHDSLDKIPFNDDAVNSIAHLLEFLYAGWEREIKPLDAETKLLVGRCARFLATGLPIAIPADTFLTQRKFWPDKFDADGFLDLATNGTWPFPPPDHG